MVGLLSSQPIRARWFFTNLAVRWRKIIVKSSLGFVLLKNVVYKWETEEVSQHFIRSGH